MHRGKREERKNERKTIKISLLVWQTHLLEIITVFQRFALILWIPESLSCINELFAL